ncbi:MAG: hypothetical protein JJV93_00940 [Alphaproteobacteria bacterium]|nr:hypothetical protein [Alphaproteobacteria bacterium]MBL0717817.1 hypothetical protein [Alphaproteobacteria bacterium]
MREFNLQTEGLAMKERHRYQLYILCPKEIKFSNSVYLSPYISYFPDYIHGDKIVQIEGEASQLIAVIRMVELKTGNIIEYVSNLYFKDEDIFQGPWVSVSVVKTETHFQILPKIVPVSRGRLNISLDYPEEKCKLYGGQRIDEDEYELDIYKLDKIFIKTKNSYMTFPEDLSISLNVSQNGYTSIFPFAIGVLSQLSFFMHICYTKLEVDFMLSERVSNIDEVKGISVYLPDGLMISGLPIDRDRRVIISSKRLLKPIFFNNYKPFGKNSFTIKYDIEYINGVEKKGKGENTVSTNNQFHLDLKFPSPIENSGDLQLCEDCGIVKNKSYMSGLDSVLHIEKLFTTIQI